MTTNDLNIIQEALGRHPPAGVLDARTPRDFAAGHLRGAASLPGAADAAPDPGRLEAVLPSIFLPPRHHPLLVMADSRDQAEALARALAARGRSRVTAVALAPEDVGRLPPHLVERGPSGRTLWEAPRWLTTHSDLLPPPALGPALDLGCGSGRAAVWLGERGYRVTGIDRQPEALALVARLAASRGVTVATLAADLRLPSALPPGPWSVVVDFRYLDRDLLARLPGIVRAGGVALVRTFREAPGLASDVRAQHRLRPAELARAFGDGPWEILAHEESFDDDGRPAAGIVARRRGIT
jgi:rhodanese-related sulfurtransferase